MERYGDYDGTSGTNANIKTASGGAIMNSGALTITTSIFSITELQEVEVPYIMIIVALRLQL